MITSRYLHHILKHPEEKNLHIDKYGWCEVKELLAALDLSFENLMEIIDGDINYVFTANSTKIKSTYKQRKELKDLDPGMPPIYLYYGISSKTLDDTMFNGLIKTKDKYVRLRDNILDAFEKCSRALNKNFKDITMLRIKAKDMYQAGGTFYQDADNTWLVKYVPMDFIEVI